jgi:hypothetical protein
MHRFCRDEQYSPGTHLWVPQGYKILIMSYLGKHPVVIYEERSKLSKLKQFL